MSNWYMLQNDKLLGPFSREHLQEAASQGKIEPSDLVREGEEGIFKTADQIPGLLSETIGFEPNSEPSVTSNQSAAVKKNSPLLRILLAGGGFFLLLFLVIQFLPAIEQARIAALRSESKNNLKVIGLGLHSYNEYYSVFPPGRTETADGTPSHSWQTIILPFLDQGDLYDQIDFEQPWIAPQNQSLFKREIPLYLNPKYSEKMSPQGLGLSHYVGNSLLLQPHASQGFYDISDDTSSTIIAIEAGENFKPWSDPTNIAKPIEILGSAHESAWNGGSQVLMSDGSVRFLSKDIDPALLKAISTPNGGENIVPE